VIGEGKVFIGSNDGQIHALEFGLRTRNWSFKAGSPVQAPPLLANHSVFAAALMAYFTPWTPPTAINSGNTRPMARFSPRPTPCLGDGPPRILVGSYDFKLYCFNATNGVPFWTYETGNYINGSCAVAGGQAVFGGCDALVHVLDTVTARRSRKSTPALTSRPRRRWRGIAPTSGITTTSFCASISTMGKVVWRYKDLDFPYMAAAAVTDDRVVFGGHDKALHCVDRADGQKPLEISHGRKSRKFARGGRRQSRLWLG
jgi:eukaryotic-like serine/threonine-protein kinase